MPENTKPHALHSQSWFSKPHSSMRAWLTCNKMRIPHCGQAITRVSRRDIDFAATLHVKVDVCRKFRLIGHRAQPTSNVHGRARCFFLPYAKAQLLERPRNYQLTDKNMRDDIRFAEHLERLAEEAFELGDRLCGSCKVFHMLWPYTRIAGASGGDVRAPPVRSVLSRLLSQGNQKLLIAGCADSGLLAVVARAANSGAHITALDRCETPLELCRRFAHRYSLPVEIVHLDLTKLAAQSKFDVVFVHMLLQFISAGQQADVLWRLRRSLRPDGRLVLVFRTSARIQGSLSEEYRCSHALRLIEELEARNIALPEPRENFRRRAEVYFDERRMREGAHSSRADVERLIKAAGFAIENVVQIEPIMSEPFRQFAVKIDKQRFLAIARPSS